MEQAGWHESLSVPVIVEVTADDISKGSESYCRRCPTALATARALGLPYVWVSPIAIYAWTALFKQGPLICSLPILAHGFIKAYDNYKPVTPFSFSIFPDIEVLARLRLEDEVGSK